MLIGDSTNTSVAEHRDSRTYRSFEACVPFCFLTASCPVLGFELPGKHHTEKELVASSLGYLLCGSEQVQSSVCYPNISRSARVICYNTSSLGHGHESRLAINCHVLS